MKIYLLVIDFMNCYGEDVEIYENENEAREALKHEYKMKRFAELYEAELIDNTGWPRKPF